jgi:hypothetical protein
MRENSLPVCRSGSGENAREHLKVWSWQCAFLFLWAASLSAVEPMSRLQDGVLGILTAHFPDAVLTRQPDGTMVFQHRIRKFMVYLLNKEGDWQEPVNMTGPDRGGLVVEFRLRPEPGLGAEGIPQCWIEDFRVFKETTFICTLAYDLGFIWARILLPVMDPPKDIHDQLIKCFTAFAAGKMETGDAH